MYLAFSFRVAQLRVFSHTKVKFLFSVYIIMYIEIWDVEEGTDEADVVLGIDDRFDGQGRDFECVDVGTV